MDIFVQIGGLMTRYVCTALLLTGVLGLIPGTVYGQYRGRTGVYTPPYAQIQARQMQAQQMAVLQAQRQIAAYQYAAHRQAVYQAAWEQAAIRQAIHQQGALEEAWLQQPARDSANRGSSLSGGFYYKPPFLPLTLEVGSDGISVDLNPEIVTPIGTFGVRGGVRSSP